MSLIHMFTYLFMYIYIYNYFSSILGKVKISYENRRVLNAKQFYIARLVSRRVPFSAQLL